MIKRTVPVELLELSFEENILPLFRTYYCLNMNSNGYVKWRRGIRILIEELKISRNTAKTHIRKLINRNWLGFDEKNKTIYIRSIQFIRWKERRRLRFGVRLYYKDLINFREFAFSGLMTKSIKVLRLRENKEGNLKEVPYQKLISLSHFPIALKLIKQRYGISKSTASRLRTNSMKLGYINCKSSFRLERRINQSSVAQIRKHHPEYGRRLRIRHGRVYIQLPTRINSNLHPCKLMNLDKVSKYGNSGKEV